MKRFLLLTAISILTLASCTKGDKVISEEEDKGGIKLTVTCKEPNTKVTNPKPGEDRYNENRILTIDYYFYPEGGTGSNAVLHKRESVGATEQYTLSISVDEAFINDILFPRPIGTCQAAVLINYPGAHPSANTDIESLKALALTADFKGNPSNYDPVFQESFVMFGTGTVDLISRKQTIAAAPTIEVGRVASKITLSAYVAPSVEITNKIIINDVEHDRIETWVPDLSSMRLYLVNGEKNAVVGGDPAMVATPEKFKYNETRFTDETEVHSFVRRTPNPLDPEHPTETTVTETFKMSYPYYTYPQTWIPNDPQEPYFKLVLPWTRQPGSDANGSWGLVTKQFYYHVILPNHSTGFESNNWYKIFLDVAILGSETDEAMVNIDGDYYVVPWNSTIVEKQVDIQSARYLSVAFNSYTMNNTTQLLIPYVSSNKCEIADLKITQYDFVDEENKDKTNLLKNCVYLDENNNIKIDHTVVNDISLDTFDAAPYVFRFKIRHQDMNSYQDTICVIQYPALYIEGKRSNSYVYIKGEDNNYTTGGWNPYHDRDIYDDGADSPYDYMGRLVNRNTALSGSGTNNNPNLYTVHVTVLPNNSTSSIGDPRAAGISGTEGDISTNPVYKLSDLTNYKRTAENTEDIIAPVFKIASSYGKTQPMTYEGAVKRCAAYQESGYPAGRWRLPTKAEINFLMNLSDKDKIPELFTPSATAGYWAGDRSFLIKSGNQLQFKDSKKATAIGSYNYTIDNTPYSVYTRCVYDVWYWGDTPIGNADTWYNYQTTNN